MGERWSRRAALPLLLALLAVVGCAPAGEGDRPPKVVSVPGDAATAQEGADLLRPGDLLLLGPGSYREELVVRTPDVTIRGEDRNEVVFDGGGRLGRGILVVADGVRVQNLTVHSYLYYGVLVTGVHDEEGESARGLDGYEPLDPARFPPLQRYAVEHVTAYNNGLYGIYAFNAQHGRIADSYVSGSADSGIYIGQCEDCDAVVAGNVAEGNAIGFENANASGPLTVIGNRFAGNRVGMTLISNYREAFAPQRSNVVAGNVIVDNAASESPAQADGGFGIGVGVAGGRDNLLIANLIAGHPAAGVVLRNTEDLPAAGNRIAANRFDGNTVDVADASSERAPGEGNCVDGDGVVALPAALAGPECASFRSSGAVLEAVQVPPGVPFLRLPAPPAQPGMADPDALPDRLPDALEHPDVTGMAVPDRSLLGDRARS